MSLDIINIDNYEAYLLDYSEGNLSKEEIAMLHNFLVLHPELNLSLEDLDLPSLTVLEESFDFKKTLKKSEDEAILNSSAIAYVEDVLNAGDKAQFELELQSNAVLKEEVAVYSKTKLPIDLDVVYPNKENLKKRGGVVLFFSPIQWSAIAAAIVILFAAVFFLRNTNGTTNTNVAVVPSKQIDTVIGSKPIVGNDSIGQGSNLVATKNSNSGVKKDKVNSIKRYDKMDSVITNPITPENNVAIKNPILQDTSVNIQNLVASTSTFSNHQTVLLVEGQDDEVATPVITKNGFWKRAVRFANQLNNFGMKAVKGEESEKEAYAISVNKFSIEKK